ncbi:MAG: hypothetical protein JJ979_14875 [Roseibium sp.]|nr:hypothetical protein [Roseibium sp.]
MTDHSDTEIQVVFTVLDLTEQPVEPGFYYHIPSGEEETDETPALAGPYPSEEDASIAARDFIKDALTTFGPLNKEN